MIYRGQERVVLQFKFDIDTMDRGFGVVDRRSMRVRRCRGDAIVGDAGKDKARP
jgi:hypothetical protein